MEFKSTSGAGGQGGVDRTTTPMIGTGGNSIQDALKWMLGRKRPRQGPAPGGPVRGAAPMPSVAQEQYRPQLAAAPARAQESYTDRWVRDPYATGYEQMANPGAKPHMVKERYIDGKWEFDNVDPRRQGGGGPGRIDTEAAPTGGYSSGPTNDPRMQNLEEASKRAGYQNQYKLPPGVPSIARTS